MWTPLETLFSSIAYAFGTIVGSLFLFAASGVLAFFLTTFEPHDGFSILVSLFSWFFVLIFATIGLVGIPFLLVHFWTLYHLIYTDDNRLQLFFTAFATNSMAFVTMGCINDFGGNWLRGLISVVFLIGCYFGVKKITPVAV